jgi:hypothetical protein
MIRAFFLIVLAILVEHLVNQIKDPRLTLAAVLIGGALLLRSWLRRSSRQRGEQVAAAAEPTPPASAHGQRAKRATAAPAGVSPVRSERAPAAHDRRWR